MLGRRRFMGGAAGLGGAGMLGALGVVSSGVGCSSNNSNEWVVGAYLSLTGQDAKFGIDTRHGIEIAVEEINAAGGIRGKKMKVLFEDDKGQAQEVTNKVQQLIDRDKVVALLGEVASALSEAAAVIASKKGVPMISPSSTNASVTEGKDFAFRVCFLDQFQGKIGAEFAVKTLGKKKVGIAFAEDDLYSNGLAKEFRDNVKAFGGEVVIEKKFSKKEMNFTTYAKELKDAGVELIYAPIYYSQMVQLGRHAKEEGITGEMWLGGDGWSGDQTLLDELEGAYFTDHHAPDLPWDPSKKFVAAYEAKHGKKPSSLAAMGYDAAAVLGDSIKRAKEDTPKAIRDAIAETKDFPGASGVITIGPDRNAQKPIVVSQIRKGSAHYAAVLGPGAEKLLGAAPAVQTAAASSTPVESAAPADSASPEASAGASGSAAVEASASAPSSATAAPSAAAPATAAPK